MISKQKIFFLISLAFFQIFYLLAHYSGKYLNLFFLLTCLTAIIVCHNLYQLLIQLFTGENNSISSDNNKELSTRETDVLQLIVKGSTNKEIADKLNISLNTVLTHRKNITAKLGIKTVSGLTFYAIMNGIISGDDIEL